MSIIDVHEILREAEAQKQARAEQLPTEYDCLRVMQQAFYRLKEMGWNEASYAPKDGGYFQAIEFGCAKPMECCYLGEWPSGRFFAAEAGDLWPSRPSLYKSLDEKKGTQ